MEDSMKKIKLLVTFLLLSGLTASEAFASINGSDPARSEEAKTQMMIAEEAFYIEPISDEIFTRIEGRSFKPDCILPREDLRYLHVLHKDLEGKTHEGEMIVNRHIAEDVLDILRKLYEADYPIEKIRLVDEYDASDEASMADNNSSSFNFRFVSYTTTVSKHGLGLAVDINTLYNPYVKTVNGRLSIEPANAGPYVDRTKDFPYKIDENDLCYQLFTEKGFFWGGHWNNSKDYQHFEIPNDRIRQWYPDWRKSAEARQIRKREGMSIPRWSCPVYAHINDAILKRTIPNTDPSVNVSVPGSPKAFPYTPLRSRNPSRER